MNYHTLVNPQQHKLFMVWKEHCTEEFWWASLVPDTLSLLTDSRLRTESNSQWRMTFSKTDDCAFPVCRSLNQGTRAMKNYRQLSNLPAVFWVCLPLLAYLTHSVLSQLLPVLISAGACGLSLSCTVPINQNLRGKCFCICPLYPAPPFQLMWFHIIDTNVPYTPWYLILSNLAASHRSWAADPRNGRPALGHRAFQECQLLFFPLQDCCHLLVCFTLLTRV